MTVTRIPACTTKGCPAPRDPDWHKPWCRDIVGHECFGDATHQHVPKRSQGGKKIVACLCAGAHDRVDNTPDWDNAVTPGLDGVLEYTLWDTRVEGGWNNPLISRTLEAGSAAAEEDKTGAAVERCPVAKSSAAALPASNDYASRFWPKVDKRGDDECWPWIGSTNPEGYGQFSLDKKLQPAYRVAYELMVGKIPEGLTIDHLCRNPNCVNPAHMEPVTERENIMRGEGVGARAARVTHCPQGHPYNEENTHTRPKGWRKCRPCDIQQKRDRRKRAKAASPASGESSAAGVGAVTPDTRRDSMTGSAAPFSLETWRGQGEGLLEMGETLEAATSMWQFGVGDWFLDGERALGEEVYGHLDTIHSPSGKTFKPGTLKQYVWVSESVSPDTRVLEGDIFWAHHRAVAALEPPKQKEWLSRAKEKHFSSRELHQAIHGEKPRVKRWSFEELEGHLCHTCRAVVSLMEAK